MRRSGTAYFSGFNVVLALVLGAMVFFSLIQSISLSSRQGQALGVKQQLPIAPSPTLSDIEAKVTVYRLPSNPVPILKQKEKKQKDKKP